MKLYCIGSAGGYPMGDNGTTSFVVTSTDGQFHLLLDAGSGSALAIEHYLPVNQLNAVWLSHDHPDHSADIGVFQHLFFLKKPASEHGMIPVYINEHSHLWPIMMEDVSTQALPYRIEEPMTIGPFNVRFIQTTHPVECAAIRLEEVSTGKVLVYTADSGWQDSLVAFAAGADILVADTNFSRSFGQNVLHMTSEEVATLANRAQVKELVVTHIPPQADAEQIMAEVNEVVDVTIKVTRALPRTQWQF
ncbi:MBL fold metallo-hydrolase [Tuanshanicoccus lijuaniae]|uniref:MBL fold metallo-hydrolase n=1 Tax=Aerococcaceae bacterium zg-1292 TaxID=2774330 RepID=UPI001BD90F53|nr:MBL fold metallo-hydrolase [Aerococcaceae bacterium zg-BR22]MBS4455748.1 MBL fold metallo-hydrolase [Aerococcaceae bacterium zg-A91]MBS4457499.1 MBL fold metallo-hydrolase [Aerococcaceae bacterium zg-BR33]